MSKSGTKALSAAFPQGKGRQEPADDSAEMRSEIDAWIGQAWNQHQGCCNQYPLHRKQGFGQHGQTQKTQLKAHRQRRKHRRNRQSRFPEKQDPKQG